MKKYLSPLLNRFLIWNQRRCYHVSIETLTLDKWWKLQETNDYSHLAKKGNVVKDHSLKSSMIYEGIYNEYIKAGGFGEGFLQLLEMKKKWIALRSEWLLTDNKMIKMDSILLGVDIEDKEKELNEKKGVSKEDALIMIGENIGGGFISANKITVAEFQNHLNYYGKKR